MLIPGHDKSHGHETHGHSSTTSHGHGEEEHTPRNVEMPGRAVRFSVMQKYSKPLTS